MPEDIADGQEAGLVVLNDAAVGRYAHFAIREGIERIDRLVGRDAGGEVYQYLDMLRRVVVHLLYLYLPFIVCLEDGVDDRGGGSPIGNLGDDERLAIYLPYLRANLD